MCYALCCALRAIHGHALACSMSNSKGGGAAWTPELMQAYSLPFTSHQMQGRAQSEDARECKPTVALEVTHSILQLKYDL